MKHLLATVALALLTLPATADERSNPRRGQVSITPGFVYYEAPDVRRHGHDDMTGGGVIVGYGLSNSWSLELLLGRGDSDWSSSLGSDEDDIDIQWVNALYKFDVASENWQPFLVAGLGHTEFAFNDARSKSIDLQVNVGLGVFRKLSNRISLRGDVRAVTSGNKGGVEPAAFVGLTAFLGEVAPPPPPPDADGDGVPNDRDQCPTTPPGREVDENGCQLDSDGDGVVDFNDRCPNTPSGAPVDRRGCPLDGDGDGVPDFRDQCPDTERGAVVDEKGCYVELDEAVTINMNIEFETNRAEIRPDHRTEIARVIDFLRKYPTANAVIGGHTDSDGSEAYNQQLSERRAKAVHDYLVAEAGIDASRLSWRGYGESQPIASNDTAAGKQKNRRVSAVVSGSQRVRQFRR